MAARGWIVLALDTTLHRSITSNILSREFRCLAGSPDWWQTPYPYLRINPMQRLLLMGIVCFGAMICTGSLQAQERRFNIGPRAKGHAWAQQHAESRPWHGDYYYLPYGQPTALVVPPTAVMQQTYSWGVSQNHVMPTYHQYGPAAYPSAGGAFRFTPIWPSHTDQFGVYPVRAPW